MTTQLGRASRFFTSQDGLRLHMHEYAPLHETASPVVCLPGLARTAEDFALLAERLRESGRRVIALDYRGRGESDWDPDYTHYSLEVEGADIFLALETAGISRAVFIGTSRGGLHTMRLAQLKPDLVLAAVLNDIGPSIEVAGLMRIKGYVGTLPPLESMAQALTLIRLSTSTSFPAVKPEEWGIFARQTFVEREGKIVARYDPQLSHTLDVVSPDKGLPEMWAEFEALAKGPVLALRGETSDILSPETLHEMSRLCPHMEVFIVPGQGHAPLLLDQPTLERIAEFVSRAP
jgi:pimeloyl-ACP methyl ester carboxylesterase